MRSNDPLISVVIPVLNGARNIQRSINSVLSQSHPNKEIIVIDGGSTDGTVEILRSNSHDIDYWTSGPDGSVYKAFNKGLHRATGDWILFMGADDYLWDEDVLSKMTSHLTTAHPRHLIVYGRTAKVMPDGRIDQIMGAPWPEFSDKLADMALGHQGIFHHRDLFQTFGNFNEFFDIAGDYEFLLRYLKKSEPIYVPDIVVALAGSYSAVDKGSWRPLGEGRRPVLNPRNSAVFGSTSVPQCTRNVYQVPAGS